MKIFQGIFSPPKLDITVQNAALKQDLCGDIIKEAFQFHRKLVG